MNSLWRNQQFVRLCIANAISTLSSKITTTALPLTAAVTLNASPQQMAMLVIAGQLPDICFGLLAGTWIDRGRHRQFLIGSDVGRALTLGCIPLFAFLGQLNLNILFAVAFISGSLTVFSSVATVAVLPSLVQSSQLIAANARLSTTSTVMTLVSPGLAGAVIQLVSAPKAILVDAVSFLASAMTKRGIGSTVMSRSTRRSTVNETLEGLKELVSTPVLRSLTLSSAVFAVGLTMQATVLMLFLTRSLGLTPVMIGFVLTAGGVGAIAGSLLASHVSGFAGIGMAIIGGTLLEAIAAFAIPLSIVVPAPIVLLIAGQIVNGIGLTIYSVNQISLRQQIVQPELLGRVTANRRFLTFCLAPVGAVLAGWIGSTLGLVEALIGAAIMYVAGTIVMWASPVRRVGHVSLFAA
ncbi:MAG: MFS transporter [Thermomicrobiales bacterium]